MIALITLVFLVCFLVVPFIPLIAERIWNRRIGLLAGPLTICIFILFYVLLVAWANYSAAGCDVLPNGNPEIDCTLARLPFVFSLGLLFLLFLGAVFGTIVYTISRWDTSRKLV